MSTWRMGQPASPSMASSMASSMPDNLIGTYDKKRDCHLRLGQRAVHRDELGDRGAFAKRAEHGPVVLAHHDDVPEARRERQVEWPVPARRDRLLAGAHPRRVAGQFAPG